MVFQLLSGFPSFAKKKKNANKLQQWTSRRNNVVADATVDIVVVIVEF